MTRKRCGVERAVAHRNASFCGIHDCRHLRVHRPPEFKRLHQASTSYYRKRRPNPFFWAERDLVGSKPTSCLAKSFQELPKIRPLQPVAAIVSQNKIPSIWNIAFPVLSAARFGNFVSAAGNDLTFCGCYRGTNLSTQSRRPHCSSVSVKHAC